MRKTAAIATILLAASVASCHRHKHHVYSTWDDYGQNYYINDGTGYYQGGYYPMWIYMSYRINDYGVLESSPGYVYRSYGRYGGGRYTHTNFGSRGSISRGSVSRSGFGSSGGHVGA